LLRMACCTSMSSVLLSTARLDAERTLRWLTSAICSDANHHDCNSRLMEAWMSAIAPSRWDKDGNEFIELRCKENIVTADEFEGVMVERGQVEDSTTLEVLVSKVTERSNFFVSRILLVLAPPLSSYDREGYEKLASAHGNGPSNNVLQGLPMVAFRVLLRSYLSGLTISTSMQLTTSILLPILCEECPQEQLLFGDQRDATGLLDLIHDVLSHSLVKGSSDQHRDADPSFTNGEMDALYEMAEVFESSKHETRFAIASIVLSLLIALLEMGSQQRSVEEEEKLQSFVPILTKLSDPVFVQGLRRDEGAALVDMATYALTLIASRKANLVAIVEKENNRLGETGSLNPRMKLARILRKAEIDLKSIHPPLRARGMVSLSRIVRGFSGALPKERSPPIVQEMDIARNDKEDNESFLVKEVLRLALVALSDPESYVYLSAVQTVVALCDLAPRSVLPLVASGVVSGKVPALDQNVVVCVLSQEQSIKLTEALVFAIRRRAVPDEYFPGLVNILLARGGQVGSIVASFGGINASEHLLIQKETNDYFSVKLGGDDEALTTRERWEEQDMRLRTGGPLFCIEETDAVRSVRISVLSELVAAASPSTVAPYCHIMVPLIVDALLLDPSRLVMRASALLTLEMYSCLLREAEDLEIFLENGDSKHSTSIPFAMAMVYSKEERLFGAISQYGKGVVSEHHMIDSTTSKRLDEAITLRDAAKGKGIFAAAMLNVDEQTALAKLPSILQISGNKPDPIQINPRDTLE
jgi:hypothetical protein